MRILLYFILISSILFLGACSKERGCRSPHALNYSPTAEIAIAGCEYPKLQVDIKLLWGGVPFEINRIYSLNGHNTAIKELDCFFSNFELTSDSINTIQFIEKLKPTYSLINNTNLVIPFGEIPTSAIKKISFQIGIDPSSNPNNTGLAQSYPDMYWGSTHGFVFLNLKGKVDRNGDGIPNENEAFDFEIGTDSLLQFIEIEPNIVLTENQHTIELELDVLQLLDNVDLQTEQSTETTDNPILAKKIADNIPLAISLKK